MAPLPVRFFARDPRAVAPELLGARLLHRLGSRTRLVGRIVEVEAYLGDGSDPASHAHRGPTRRNQSMFGPPGRFYVYRSMGLHYCVNVVCAAPGHGAAVLLRAIEPLEGQAAIRRARGGRSGPELCNGPGKLCQAFGIGPGHDGSSAVRGSLRIEAATLPHGDRVMAGPRIGISRARELPYRYFLADSPFVSRSPLNRAAEPLLRVCSGP